MQDNYKQEITRQARKFREKMDAPLIYCSAAQNINVKNVFKIIVAMVFDLKPKIKEHKNTDKDAILEFQPRASKNDSRKEKTKKKKKKKRQNKEKQKVPEKPTVG